MITEYAVPSLALNYHSKNTKYIIYESVYIVIQVFVYMPEKKKYSCKSAFVWNDHIKVIKSNVESDEKIYGASNFAAG